MLSVEPWLVEQREGPIYCVGPAGFSALSRAVVGGTTRLYHAMADAWRFSALSRAVVGGTW